MPDQVPWSNPLIPPYAQGAAPPTSYSYPPGSPTYPSQPATVMQITYPPPNQGPRPGRKRLIAVIAGVCLVALLGASGFWLYTTFAAHSQTVAAQYLPANTVSFVSFDLVAAAANGHSVTTADLTRPTGNAQNDPLKAATGLDWQTDVLPWIDRNIAVGVFLDPRGGTATPTSSNRIGGVLLLQSRDDSAAQAALTKVANFLKEQGGTITSSTYGGFTLYTDQQSPTQNATFFAGKGWAVIASDLASAQTVADRLNGTGETLASSPAFQRAIAGLPSSRFGTAYVDLKALAQDIASHGTDVPFLDTYPVAVGFTTWTNAGLRAQVTLKSSRSTGVPNLTGNLTSLASLVPANAQTFAAVGNFGALSQQIQKDVQPSGLSILATFLGIPAANPALAQPAAVAALGNDGLVYLLRAPDATAAQGLVQEIVNEHNWTTQSTQIGGHDFTAMYDTQPGEFLGSSYGGRYYNGDAGPFLVGYTGIVNGVLVMSTSKNAILAVTQSAGSGSSLATLSAYSSLSQQAPAGAAASVFVNYKALDIAQGSSPNSLVSRMTGLLVTSNWDDSQLQTTFDVGLSS